MHPPDKAVQYKNMAKYITNFLKKEPVAEKTLQLQFARPEGFTYRPGQTIDLTLIHPLVDDADGNTRTLSLASTPDDELLSVATRIRDSAFKKNIEALHQHTEVLITGPFGSFTLHQNSKRPAVFLAGGIGITPFYSIINDAIKHTLPHSLFLFYANRRPEDAPFLSELKNLSAQHAQFHFIPTMTNMSQSKQHWEGIQGHISEAMLTAHIPNDMLPIYYLAGPSNMVMAMQNMLHDMLVDTDSIKIEEFPGY